MLSSWSDALVVESDSVCLLHAFLRQQSDFPQPLDKGLP
ncbi:hypothetical protein CP061683_0395, partial [Chlamydia psittaci 06-1683]